MNLVYSDKQKRVIHGQEQIEFSSFSSFRLIILTARARGEKQFTPPATDDEDLVVRIDNKNFPKLTDSHVLIDSPASFNGGKLHNLPQTIYFLTFLKGKSHKIILEADKPHSTAIFESIEVYTLDLSEQLVMNIGKQADDGDRRTWLTFVLDNLPLKSFTPNITYHRRFMDSDDVKVISDGKVQISLSRGLKHLFWFFAGSLIPKLSFRTESEKFVVNFPPKPHYIEFYADRMPILHHLTLDFATKPSFPEGVPTVENPKWTSNFYDDAETVLLARAIYGEAGGESYEVKTAVGWSIRNRVKDRQKRWANSYHGVILELYQYAPFLDPNQSVFKRMINPPLLDSKEKDAWGKSFKAAENVIFDKVLDPTNGANHFFANYGQAKPSWAQESKFTLKFGVTEFYKL